jgi:CubicO group peptidase (beta-lactamase class C family)
MSKSFASALVGILVREGKLDLFAPVPVPEWSDPADPRHAITIDDLMRLTAGLDLSGPIYPDPDSDFARILEADDAFAYVAQKRLQHPPGTEFAYTDVNGVLVGGVMADLVGGGYAFRDFARTALFDKIGIHRVELRLDPAGNWLASVFADMTARSFVKLGLLYLRDGVWNGDRILPEGWVDYSRAPTAANPEYGAGWWLDVARPGVFYAIGHNGQAMAVDPAHDLTYVTLSTDGKMSLPVGEAIQQAFEAAD